MARHLVSLFSIILLAAGALAHDNTADLGKRACKPAQPIFENGGFESGHLTPWKWTWTNHSVPMTANVVDHGYKSGHSVEIFANAAAQYNHGYLRQNFRICNNVDQYRVSYYYYQVPGGTTYNDEIEEQREFSLFVIDPNNYANWVGDFTLYKTYTLCSFCRGTRHYPAGQWHEFYGDFYADQVGEYTIELRSEVDTVYEAPHNVQTRVRIDSLNIKKIGSA